MRTSTLIRAEDSVRPSPVVSRRVRSESLAKYFQPAARRVQTENFAELKSCSNNDGDRMPPLRRIGPDESTDEKQY